MSKSWEERPFQALPGTIQHTLTLGPGPTDRWRVTVSMPPSGPGGQDDRHPALYLVDGHLTFVVAAQVALTTMAMAEEQFGPVAIVGISPDSDDPDRLDTQRNRDLTPTESAAPSVRDRTPFGTGGAAPMLELIRDEIAPHLEAVHNLDPGDRGLGGWSFGGLFTAWALIAHPHGFRRFLAVSPSVWWDDRLLVDPGRLPAVAAPEADVYLAIGENERGREHAWPRPADGQEMYDMVADMALLTNRFERERRRFRAEVITDEHHSTVWAAAITRGLVHLYGHDGAGQSDDQW